MHSFVYNLVNFKKRVFIMNETTYLLNSLKSNYQFIDKVSAYHREIYN